MHPTQAMMVPSHSQAAHPPSKGSPFPERCRHVTVGSGLPKARHMRVTLLPSFTVMSDEMLTIWGGTARHKGHQRHHQHTSLPGTSPDRHVPSCDAGVHSIALSSQQFLVSKPVSWTGAKIWGVEGSIGCASPPTPWPRPR